jgi:PAS domain S-box-containing protein
MTIFRPLAASLTRRFALAAAALATAALLLITVSSWWLVRQQHAAAVDVLNRKEAEFHAAAASRVLHGIASRLSEVAGSSILATGLVDSTGRETYLTPYLNSIKQVSGVPVQILFTDFEGVEISSNGNAGFSGGQVEWLRRQLQAGKRNSAIFTGPDGPEVLALEPMGYNRTQTPEGALLYKIKLEEVIPVPSVRLGWGGRQAAPGPAGTEVVLPIDVPDIFRHLGLRLHEKVHVASPEDLAPQYATIFVIALALAGGVFVIGSRLALALTRDLRRLEVFSRTVVKGGFGVRRAEVTGSSEVAGLARSINHMLDRLYDQHSLLQHESEKLHQLANTIPQLAWMANPDGWIHWYNDRWYEYTGSAFTGMQGWGWESVVDPAELPEVARAWQASLSTGTPFEMTFRLRAADGSFNKFFARAAPLRDSSGNIVQWFGTNTDVSPLEEAERALRESRERLKEGMVAARMAVWDWDLGSGRIEFSENAGTVLGGRWQSIDSTPEAVHPDDRKPLRAACRRAIRECGEFHQVVRLLQPGRHEVLWVDIRGRTRCDAAGRPVSMQGIALDVTERKRAEEELREVDRRKDEFLAMLAHELRNPLAPISAAAELLKLLQPDAATVVKTSDIIARQVDHMTSLVNDLLDVSRVTRGLVTLGRAPLEMKDIVADAVEQVSPLIEARRHWLALRLPDQPARVTGDRKRLVQVLANLLNNAAKYTPEGGRIELRMEVAQREVELTVSDNGIGIDSKVLPRVFDLFTQAERSPDRSQGGLGLGLALVKSLVELHGGRVLADSAGAGTGATFTIRLPRADRSAADPLPRDGSAGLPRTGRPLRLMVVDDNRDAARSLAMLLRAGGHEVAIEYEPLAALARARDEAPEACLLDIGLPGMDGNELARRLRALPQTAHALLIAITGYGQDCDRAASMAAGFDHYFVKPADIGKLAAALADYGSVAAPARMDRQAPGPDAGAGINPVSR